MYNPSGKMVAAALVAALGVYCTMLFVTLPHLTVLSGGMRVFDMMPAGYDKTLAHELLSALGQSGRAYYLTRQIPVDMVYPLLFAVSHVLLARWLATKLPKRAKRFRWIALAPIFAAAADYGENIGVIWMLRSYPLINEAVVQISNIATLVKSGTTTAFYFGLCVLLVVALADRLRNRT